MAAMKRFYEQCAEAGRCPIGPETCDYLDQLEQADPMLDWIEYTEHGYPGRDGWLYIEDCITMESARQLVVEGLANGEIAALVECFGGYLDVACTDCGCHRPITRVSCHGEQFCADCE